MNDSARTLTFVAVAGALAATAFGMHLATRPVSLDEYSDVGEEFYPDFNNPTDATGLRVAAYNEDAARVDVFSVEQKDGLWRIPSHHDYPADGKDKLAKTATSIIGLQRDALVSTSADDHKRLGVLDPLDETVTGTKGRGDRITLSKGDQTLADYIIGTKIEDGPQNTYHVRRADEDRTYRVTLDIDLSTKFADWIEPDLLDFRRGDIRELVIDRYSIDETRGVMVQGEKSVLTRGSQDDPWTLAGIQPDQKVKVSTVNQIINALEDVAIVGVRPKPAGLSADLKQGSIIAKDGSVSMTALRDLQARGFFLLPDGSLKSNEGEATLALANGVKYVLGFGEVFTGTDVEIEVGKSSSDEPEDSKVGDDAGESESGATDKASADTSAEASAEGADEATSTDAESEDDSLKKNRYLFILTQFDESVLEPLPEQPVKPEPPAKETSQTDDADESNADADEAKGDGESADADAGSDDDKSAEAAESPADEYQQALADYETKLKDWEQRKTEREEKIKAGKKRVEELNARFADWYYVISAEKFDDIRVQPDELVEAEEPPKKDDGETPETPAAETPKMKDEPAETPAAESKPQPAAPKEDKPAAEKPESSEAAKPADEQPAKDESSQKETAKTEEKPAESKDSADKPPEEPEQADQPDDSPDE